MSHELRNNDSAAFNARPAWHGIGNVIPEGDLSVETVERHAPGFVFPIESRPLFVGEPDIVWGEDGGEVVHKPGAEVPGQVAQVAADTGEVLGITGEGFAAFPNRRLLDLVSEVSAFGEGTTLESVLTLKGRRVAVVLAHAGSFALPGDDQVEQYLLWTTAHDGSSALRVLPTSIRVVCKNTLTMALNSRGRQGFTVRHTANMEQAIREGVDAMRRTVKAAEGFEEAARAMASRDMTEAELRSFFTDVYQASVGPVPTNPQTRGERSRRTRAIDTVSRWMMLLDDEKQRMDGRTTVWSALNSVTQHADHERTVKRTGGASSETEARTWSRLLGTAAEVKAKALDRALALI